MVVMSNSEQQPQNDQAMTDAIVDFQLNLMKQTTPAVRGQHPKMHGCLKAEFRVIDDLAADVAVGVFAQPRSYPAWIRFSNAFSPDDRAPDFHGMAIKLMDVPGEKLADEKQTQDFLLIDAPYFFAGNVETLLRFMQQKVSLTMQGKTPPEQMQALSVDFPAEVERFLKTARPLASPPTSFSYWSCVPSQLGDQTVKYMAAPSDDEPTSQSTGQNDSENYGRDSLVQRLKSPAEPVIFDFCIQKQLDENSEPAEDASVEWKSPFVKVAEITIPLQSFNNAAHDEFGENLSFNPWHSMPEHQPLGGLNRARKTAYPKSSALRHQTRSQPLFEPYPDDNP